MTRGILANAVYLECLAFVVTTLLAASDVEGKDQTRETSGVVGRAEVNYNSHSLCYNSQRKEVNCSKKKGIIVGSVIGVLALLLGVLYLYGTWKERRKRRKGSSTAEENEPLSDGVRTVSDCEKGITKASESKKHDDDGHVIPSSPHLDKSEEASVSGANSFVPDLPGYGYDRPPGLTRTGTPFAMPDPNRTSSTNLGNS